MNSRSPIKLVSRLGRGMVVAVVGALLGAPVVDAAVTTSRVTGTDVGVIPNDPGTLCGGTGAKPRDVHFDVSGITGPIRDVSVEFTLNPAHSWIGDLDVLLIAPGGAEHRLFGGVGSTTPNNCGDSSDLEGPISFSDDAPAQPTLWGAAAAASGAVPSGAYRASTNGGGPSGGQPTSITATFASLRGNGLWTLRFTDRSPTDTGSVSSAALSIRHGNPAPPPGPEVLFDNGPLGTGTTTDGGDPAPPGAEWSELQHPVGDLSEANLFLGESMDGPFDNERVADDFTVPAGETWTIGSFDTYGFTSGLPAPGRFYSATLQIWTGPPSTPSGGFTRLFGDGSTNRLAATEPTGIYRTLNTVAPAAADPQPRMIWRNSIEVDPPLTLPPGTYWAEWAGHAHFDSFAPQVTVKGARGRPGANGRKFLNAVGVWSPANDVGNPLPAPDFPQDFAFRLLGSRAIESQTADDPSDGPLQSSPTAPRPPAPDTTAPNTLIKKAPKPKNRKRTVKIKFSASEPGATFRCALNRKPPSRCTSPMKVKAKLGGNRFTVTATDSAGNSDPTPAVAKWVRKPKPRR